MSLFFVVIRISGYRASLFINGKPVMTSLGFLHNVVQVNQWIVQGENVLEVQIDEEATANGPRSLDVHLGEGDPAEIPGEGEYRRHADIPPLSSGPLPRSLTARCLLSPPFPRWKWQDATPLPLTESVQSAIIDRVAKLHGILVRRDLDALVDAAQIVLQEVPPAYGYSTADGETRLRSMYDGIFHNDDYAVAPFEPSKHVFRQCCGGRLTTLETKDGDSILRAAQYDTTGGWSLPFWFGQVRDTWMHLR